MLRSSFLIAFRSSFKVIPKNVFAGDGSTCSLFWDRLGKERREGSSTTPRVGAVLMLPSQSCLPGQRFLLHKYFRKRRGSPKGLLGWVVSAGRGSIGQTAEEEEEINCNENQAKAAKATRSGMKYSWSQPCWRTGVEVLGRPRKPRSGFLPSRHQCSASKVWGSG